MLDNISIVIFSGYNQRAVIAFLRILQKYAINYLIIARDKRDPIFFTDYSKKVFYIRKNISLDKNEIINVCKLIKKEFNFERHLIAPSTEALNRFLLNNRIEFESIGFEIPLVEKELYELISDKYSFSKLCSDNNITIPTEDDKFYEAEIPFVAKPKKYFTGDGNIYSPVLILNKKIKHEFENNYNIDDFYFQEFVNGESLYLLYYFKKNGEVISFSQKNIAQQPNGKSIVGATTADFHNTYESDKYIKLLQKIGFRGLIMIEVKKSGNRNYMIEANPRFWGPSQLFVDSNVPIFESFLEDYDITINNALKEKPFKKDVKYFWFGGIISVFSQGECLTFHEGNEEKFMLELPTWLSFDIYRRKDTINYFKQEMNKNE